MFILTSEVTIGTVGLIKPSKIEYKTDVNSFVDTCTIEVPRVTFLRNNKIASEDLNQPEPTNFVIKEGDAVIVKYGYNKRNFDRFKGFVKRVIQGTPVKIECEGYAYLLYDIYFSKSYAKTTVKQILNDLLINTPIKLSPEIPDVPLTNVRFKNASGIQVLEYLKNEIKLAVYFNHDALYVGTIFGKKQETVKLKLGWNTIKDESFKLRELDKRVKINIVEKNAAGEQKRTPADVKKYSTEKDIKIKQGLPSDLLKQIAERLQTKENYGGHQGDIELFLEPFVEKGYVAELDGYRYPEKSGRYFVEAVKSSYSTSGGRQTISLTYFKTYDN